MQISDDEKKSLFRAKYQLECGAVPITWRRTVSGIKIKDMLHADVELVTAFVEKWHVPDDMLCKLSKLKDDPASLSYYLKNLESTLQQGRSLIAVDRDGVIVGVLVLNVVDKLDFGRVYSRERLRRRDAYDRYVEIRTRLIKDFDAYIEYGCEVFVRFHLVCGKPHDGHEDLVYLLLGSGMDVASAYGIPIIGIFTSSIVQRTAERLGFEKVRAVEYGDYFDGFESDNDDGTMECVLMVARVPVAKPRRSSDKQSPETEVGKVQGKKRGKHTN